MPRTRTRVVLAGLVAVGISGCLGPRALQRGRLEYNRSVRATEDQELLLNVVRLRYLDGLKFLNVGSISTQFSYDAGFGVVQNTAVNDKNHPGFRLDTAVSERPTISYAPAEGEEFTRRLISPVELPLVALMGSSGWPVDRIFLLAMSHINGVPNTPFSDYGADGRPDNRVFVEGVQALAQLQRLGEVELTWQEVTTALSPEVALAEPSSADVMAASAKGLEYHRHASGKGWVLERRDRQPVLRLSPTCERRDEVRKFRAAFALKAGTTIYPLRAAVHGQTATARTGWDGTSLWISTRSLMEIMYYMSVGVVVPAVHQARGEVPAVKDAHGHPIEAQKFLTGLFRVESGSERPSHTSLAVKHRDQWFWIAESDVSSRGRLSDLAEMFNLVVRAGGATQAPVLTLPVGR